MKNKELKQEIIEYFIKEYYSNFKELCEVFTLNELKKRLNKNIKKLVTNKKSVVYLGRYYIINKKIKIYNKNINNKKLEIDDIKSNLKLKSTLIHEFTHALLRKNIVTTGCFTANFSLSMFKHYPRSVVKNRGLNEGITNWIVEKSGIRTVSYRLETNIVKQLEVILGSKNILNVILEKSKNVYKILNLTKKEFKKFSEMLDNINYIDIKLIRKINKHKDVVNLRKKREQNAITIQKFIFNKYIHNNLSNSNMLKIYTLMLEYQNIIDTKIEEVVNIEKKLKANGLL